MSQNKRYENFIVFLAPFINSVGGIAIDLYAPSIPSIGRELAASPSLMQNTITITLISYAIGQLFFGIMADSRGRKSAVILGLLMFIAGSLLATFSTSIEMLLLARALQGFAIGSCQVVARALLVDNIKGERFGVAIIYLSLAFGLGPVIAPFIGGKVEEWLGWRYNFVLYSLYGLAVLGFVLGGLRESLTPEKKRTAAQTIRGYRSVITDVRFMSSVIIIGGSFSAFLMWNVIGPYIVQDKLGYSASFFGSTALGVGVCYLSGTLLNRALIKRVASEQLMKSGVALFVLGIAVMLVTPLELTLWSALLGVMIVAFGQGFIFSNAMARSMSLFPDRAGVAASLQGCLMLVFGSIASGLASYVPSESNWQIAGIFAALLALSLVGFVRMQQAYRHALT
ncbi:MFS transporter [Pseudomonas sp. SDI]|uniref:multidrug effflux MFS transporter n=1 Tax=Pseudomonas sp. SDI TaxID=2170734 RepID=UPI000DE62265|nr:multidrug effflux MFS transporter [Pseudomonas sp. SDI]PWB31616.1 MFS transporter [Pseudomonas sp. SDI]